MFVFFVLFLSLLLLLLLTVIIIIIIIISSSSSFFFFFFFFFFFSSSSSFFSFFSSSSSSVAASFLPPPPPLCPPPLFFFFFFSSSSSFFFFSFFLFLFFFFFFIFLRLLCLTPFVAISQTPSLFRHRHSKAFLFGRHYTVDAYRQIAAPPSLNQIISWLLKRPNNMQSIFQRWICSDNCACTPECWLSNLFSHPVTVHWHWANQSQHWPFHI